MSAPPRDGCALVTGASRGIGAACARALAEMGWPVIANYREDADGARGVVEEIERGGGRAKAVAADVSREEAPDILMEATRDGWGPALVVVNNAGRREDGLALQLEDDAWSHVLDANLCGPFRICRAFIPKMVRARFGRVVNVASIAGLRASRGQVNYAASKAGLIGMTRTLAAEVAHRGVTVNAVAPGFIGTEMTWDVSDDVLSKVPAGRFGRPDEIAACVGFLASEGAGYVTGTTLVADGGFSA